MFKGCSKLTSISELDFSNVTSITYIFGTSDLKNLTNLGGFKNLGAQPSLSVTSSYQFNKAPNMTYESIMNIINNLYDRKSAGYSVITLKFASKTLALLSDEEKTIATNKGWTLTT
jgi:surface protein